MGLDKHLERGAVDRWWVIRGYRLSEPVNPVNDPEPSRIYNDQAYSEMSEWLIHCFCFTFVCPVGSEGSCFTTKGSTVE